MKIYARVGSDPRTNRLDFRGDPGLDPDPGFQNPDQDADPEFFVERG